MAYIDYMDCSVHCPEKAFKINHSLTWLMA